MALLSFPSPRQALQARHIGSLVVFRALQLGDMLCAVPTLRALRSGFPKARITLVGLPWAAEFARRFGMYVDEFIPFPGHPLLPELPVREEQISLFYRSVRSRHFDLAIQLHGSGEITNPIVAAFGAEKTAGFVTRQGSRHPVDIPVIYPSSGPEPLRLLRMASALVAPTFHAHLEFPLYREDWSTLEKHGLLTSELHRYQCIHPGARHRTNRWPAHSFAKIADQLSDEFGLATILTGSGDEAQLAATVAALMKKPSISAAAAALPLGAMAALISKAQLLICNDTGASHIAAALDVPSVVIFNKADMERWAPMDRTLHPCIADPEGVKIEEVATAARQQLAPFSGVAP